MSAAPERCLLVVEDDPNDRLLLERAARKAGLAHPLRLLQDGEQAIAYLAGEPPFDDRARHPLPAFALIDVKLPRKSGLEVLAWLRARPALRRLPVALLSSSRLPDDVRRAYDAGASSYLVKPVEFEALCQLLVQVGRYWLDLNRHPDLVRQ